MSIHYSAAAKLFGSELTQNLSVGSTNDISPINRTIVGTINDI